MGGGNRNSRRQKKQGHARRKQSVNKSTQSTISNSMLGKEAEKVKGAQARQGSQGQTRSGTRSFLAILAGQKWNSALRYRHGILGKRGKLFFCWPSLANDRQSPATTQPACNCGGENVNGLPPTFSTNPLTPTNASFERQHVDCWKRPLACERRATEPWSHAVWPSMAVLLSFSCSFFQDLVLEKSP